MFPNQLVPLLLLNRTPTHSRSKTHLRSRKNAHVHRELTDEEIKRIAQIYHAWRGEKEAGKYEDIPGFCKSAKLEEIVSHGYVLTPGRYVGAEEVEDDDETFEEKMLHLTKKLEQQFEESARLEAEIRENLRGLGFNV